MSDIPDIVTDPAAGAANTEPPVVRVSPSQIEAFLGCEAKWAFDKILRLPRKANKYAAAGHAVHKALERWQQHGESPDPSTIPGAAAIALLPHVPVPGRIQETDEWGLETRIEFEHEGIIYLGDIDIHWRDGPDSHVVNDYKSTSDLKWAKSEDTLRTDAQRVIYAMAAVQLWGAKEVTARWLYTTRTKYPQTAVRQFTEDAAEIFDRFVTNIHPVGLRIAAAKREPFEARPKNFQHCGAFGGCPYRERCHRDSTPADRLSGILAQANKRRFGAEKRNEDQMSLLDQLKEQNENDAPPAGAAGATPANGKDPNPPAAPPPSGSLMDQLGENAPEEKAEPEEKKTTKGNGKAKGTAKAKTTKSKTSTAPPSDAKLAALQAVYDALQSLPKEEQAHVLGAAMTLLDLVQVYAKRIPQD